ncbi:MAG: hypothetical protein R3B91_18185 [Planctomycetaceae bacterium]
MPAIDVTYASRSSREVLVIVAAGVMLLMWWARLTGPALRIVLVVFTIIVPPGTGDGRPLAEFDDCGRSAAGRFAAGLILWAVRAMVMAVTAKTHTHGDRLPLRRSHWSLVCCCWHV